MFLNGMAIKTNITDLTPAVDRLKRELDLVSGGYSLKEAYPSGRVTVWPWDPEIAEWVVDLADKSDDDNDNFSASVVAKLVRRPKEVVDRFIASELLLIMLFSRAIASDGSVTYTPTCPHCGFKHPPCSIQIPGNLGVIGKKLADYVGFDTVILPVSKDVLTVKPLTVRDADIATTAEMRKKSGLSNTSLRAMAAIMTVGGGTPESLDELLAYYKALVPHDREYLAKTLNEQVNPGLDTRVPHKCDRPSCGKEFKHNLGLTYDFFL